MWFIVFSLGLVVCGGFSSDLFIDVDIGVGIDDSIDSGIDDMDFGIDDISNEEGMIYGLFSIGMMLELVVVYFDLDI